MIVNTVLLKLKDRDADKVKEAQAVLLGMRGKIDVLLDLRVEESIRPEQTTYDLLLITKYASLEDLDAYLTHPAHLEVAKYVGGVLDIQASFCYEIK